MQLTGPPSPYVARADVLSRPAEKNATDAVGYIFAQERQSDGCLFLRCLSGALHFTSMVPWGYVFWAIARMACRVDDEIERRLSRPFPPDLPVFSPELQPRNNYGRKCN
jgi:hypothetical protein